MKDKSVRFGPRLIGPIRRIALALLTVFAIAALVLWIGQERLVFVPPPPPAQQGHGATRIDFVASDGQRLFGFFVSASSPELDVSGQELILLFHGNGDLAESWVEWARDAAGRTGWSVFIPEFRGYGGLPGRPTYDGIMRDARAALALLEARFGVEPGEVVFYGHSLGTGIATELAVEYGARAVVLEAPITSVVDVGRQTVGPPLSWILPVISRIDLAPVDDVRNIRAPVWVVSGEEDEVAPAWMGRRVFGAAAHKGQFLLIPGGRHGNISDQGGDLYWSWLCQALGL